MKNREIMFVNTATAELAEHTLEEFVPAGCARVKTVFSAVSAGTERDNLMAEPNVAGKFPCQLGYSASGMVDAVGEGVTDLAPGDPVVVSYGTHSEYTVLPAEKLIPIRWDVPMDQAALTVIGSFPAEGVRKTHLEFGESALIMGLGVLGLFAVQLARIAGAVPVVACDIDPKRRALALSMGADAALDPTEPDFRKKLCEVIGKDGADVCVDASGHAEATKAGLDAMDWFGRVSLLGCTRHPAEYDFYKLIHLKGIQVFGAHTLARPARDSRPGCWTSRDDIEALLKLAAAGRLDLGSLIHEVHSPEACPEVYRRLCREPDFPIGVLFDWRKLS